MHSLKRIIAALIISLPLLSLPASAQKTDSVIALCLSKCSNGTGNVVSNCFKGIITTNAGTVNVKVNPYTEFDQIISTLKKDPKNPYPLIYQFQPCEQVCNAVAIMVDTLRFIYYNQDFLNNVKTPASELKWVVRSIIAHEIGHHILEHTIPKDDKLYPAVRRKQELLADYFSAFVIKQFSGSTLDQALSMIQYLNTPQYYPKNEVEEDQAEYPTLDKRREAIIEGFTQEPDHPVRIAMFRTLDSLGLSNYANRGKTILLRDIGKEISLKNIKEAQEKLEQLEKYNLDPQEKQSIDKLKSLIKPYQQPGGSSRIDLPTLDESEIQQLRNLYDKIKNSKFQKDQIEAKKLLEKIKALEKAKAEKEIV